MLTTKLRFIWPSGFVSEEKIFRTRNKNCLWWPYLLMDRDEMSKLYREPSIDAYYQVSFHLAKRFQRRRLKFDYGCKVMGKAHIAYGQGELKKTHQNQVKKKLSMYKKQIQYQP